MASLSLETLDRVRVAAPAAYRADIDGLRAIAVIAVVLFHAGVFPFASGYVGVDIFFVISGYLIGGIILRDVTERRFSFARFYARRARRILPALFAVVLTTCIAGWFLLSPLQFKDVGATAVSTLLGMSNISFYRFTDYFVSDSRRFPLLMTWSLGVEEQFYLFFPLVLFAIMRWVPRWTMTALTVLATASFVVSARVTYSVPGAAFYLLPFRAWELAAGVILALFHLYRSANGMRSRPDITVQGLGVAGIVCLAVSICAFDANTSFPGFAALLPVLGTVALIAAETSWVNRNVLAARPMVFVGLVSYSFYLWHWPLMSLVRNVAYDEPPLSVMLATAAAAFGIAVLSWRFIEQPFRHGPVHVRRVLTGYAVALAAALVIPLAIKVGNGFPSHVPAAVRQVEAMRTGGTGSPCLANWDDDRPNLSPACSTAVTGRPTLVIIGDSHAAALGPGVRMLAKQHDWGYEIMTKSSCRPLLGVTSWRHAEPQLVETCAAFMQAAFARATADPRVETVILAGMWPLDDADDFYRYEHFEAVQPYTGSTDVRDLFHYGFDRAVAQLVGAGKHVIVLGDVPRWRFDVGQVALTAANPARSMLARWLWSRLPEPFPQRPGLDLVYPQSATNTRLFQSISQQPSVSYVNLFPRFCGAEDCSFEHDGKTMFIDTGHLSEAGAEYALKDLFPQ